VFERVRLVFLFLALTSFSLTAQELTVRGGFRADSIKIGIAYPFTLSASYPKTENILFPDSTFSFAPFEFDRKVYFPTQTRGDYSRDSVVYYLTSFEIDSVQYFRLPIFIVNERDCTAVYSRVDSVFLQQMVAQVPDSVSIEQLPLKTNTAYQTVSWLLNYPLLLIAGGSVLVIIIVVWIVFGKRIKTYFLLRKLNKNHNEFLQEFNTAVDRLQSSFSTKQAEATLLLWKKYMERLQSSPYTKFTTKEIFKMVNDKQLADALSQIDRTIYRESKAIEKDPLTQLQDYTERQFNDKLQEVKNG